MISFFLFIYLFSFQIKQIKTKLILKSKTKKKKKKKKKTPYKLRTNITGVEVQISQALRLYVDASEIKRKKKKINNFFYSLSF